MFNAHAWLRGCANGNMNFDEGKTVEELVDSLISTAPVLMLDSRTYYWPNFKLGNDVKYFRDKFVYCFPLGTLRAHPNVYYVCSFTESLLLTWIGIECSVQRYTATSYNINLNVVDGMNPYSNKHNNVFSYYKINPPINRFEPSFVHKYLKIDKIDTGTEVHKRVHNGYAIEMEFSFDQERRSSIVDAKICVKVQHPSRVGGTVDHPSWDKTSIKHSYNRKNVVNFKSFDKYVLKGDNELYYSE